jgi:hypothetical protein
MWRLPVCCLALVGIAGCGEGPSDLMPLSVGDSWVYLTRTGIKTYTQQLTVERPVAVGDVEGYELAGDLGVAHLAWSHGRLITDQMVGTRFDPPLVLYAPTNKDIAWSGAVYSSDRKETATGTVGTGKEKLDLLGRTVETQYSTVWLRVGTRNVVLKTWFEPGTGIVRQEQKTDNRLDLVIEYLGKG